MQLTNPIIQDIKENDVSLTYPVNLLDMIDLTLLNLGAFGQFNPS